MRLLPHIYLVGSGSMGFSMSDDYDCHVYLIDGGSEATLVDCGAGMGIRQILDVVRADGIDADRIRTLLLTHGHGDHAGGTAHLIEQLGRKIDVLASPLVAGYIRNADEQGISLDMARAAGIYPPDYRLLPAPVSGELREGDSIKVGQLRVQVFDTPGHAGGHLSFLLEDGGKCILFAGDTVFFGGQVSILATHDCSIPDYRKSIEKLATLQIDTLLPGHLTPSLSKADRHIQTAMRALNNLSIPRSIL